MNNKYEIILDKIKKLNNDHHLDLSCMYTVRHYYSEHYSLYGFGRINDEIKNIIYLKSNRFIKSNSSQSESVELSSWDLSQIKLDLEHLKNNKQISLEFKKIYEAPDSQKLEILKDWEREYFDGRSVDDFTPADFSGDLFCIIINILLTVESKEIRNKAISYIEKVPEEGRIGLLYHIFYLNPYKVTTSDELVKIIFMACPSHVKDYFFMVYEDLNETEKVEFIQNLGKKITDSDQEEKRVSLESDANLVLLKDGSLRMDGFSEYEQSTFAARLYAELPPEPQYDDFKEASLIMLLNSVKIGVSDAEKFLCGNFDMVDNNVISKVEYDLLGEKPNYDADDYDYNVDDYDYDYNCVQEVYELSLDLLASTSPNFNPQLKAKVLEKYKASLKGKNHADIGMIIGKLIFNLPITDEEKYDKFAEIYEDVLNQTKGEYNLYGVSDCMNAFAVLKTLLELKNAQKYNKDEKKY